MIDAGGALLQHAPAGFHRADHSALVGALVARADEADQRPADAHDLARLGEQLFNSSRLRRRNLHDRLRRFDRDERLIGRDLLARGDMPLDELGLLQSFAEIGKTKDVHADASIVSRTAAAMRSTLGKYWCSSRASGMTTS